MRSIFADDDDDDYDDDDNKEEEEEEEAEEDEQAGTTCFVMFPVHNHTQNTGPGILFCSSY